MPAGLKYFFCMNALIIALMYNIERHSEDVSISLCVHQSPLHYSILNSSCLVLSRFSAPSSLLKVSTGLYLVLLPWVCIQEFSPCSNFGGVQPSPCLLPMSLGSLSLIFIDILIYIFRVNLVWQVVSACRFTTKILLHFRTLPIVIFLIQDC